MFVRYMYQPAEERGGIGACRGERRERGLQRRDEGEGLAEERGGRGAYA